MAKGIARISVSADNDGHVIVSCDANRTEIIPAMLYVVKSLLPPIEDLPETVAGSVSAKLLD